MLPQFTVIFLLLFHYLWLKIFFEVPLNLLYLPQILNNYISQFFITHSSGRKCCKSGAERYYFDSYHSIRSICLSAWIEIPNAFLPHFTIMNTHTFINLVLSHPLHESKSHPHPSTQCYFGHNPSSCHYNCLLSL